MPCRTGTFAYLHTATSAISRRIQASPCCKRSNRADWRSLVLCPPNQPAERTRSPVRTHSTDDRPTHTRCSRVRSHQRIHAGTLCRCGCAHRAVTYAHHHRRRHRRRLPTPLQPRHHLRPRPPRRRQDQVATSQPQSTGMVAQPAPIIAAPPPTTGHLAAYGSDMPRSPTPPPPPPAPTITTSGGPSSAQPGAATVAGSSASAAPLTPGMLASSGVAAAGTGAAMVSSETKDKHLDNAVRLAYELWHASRMHPGIHWCVGIFKTGSGIETVITTNDGAGYIPPGVFIPRTARLLFADPLLRQQLSSQVVRMGEPRSDHGRLCRPSRCSRSELRTTCGCRHDGPRRIIRPPRSMRRCTALPRLRFHTIADTTDRSRTRIGCQPTTSARRR